jgi:hypothetical protein
VDQNRIVVTPEGTLVLPLSQASSRRAAVAFTLRRSATRDVSRLELPLPMPLADSIGTGELTVRSTPDIELLPDLANSTGLVSAPSLPGNFAASGDDGGRLHFRTLLPMATFVTDRSTRPRDVITESTTLIDIQAEVAQIDQRIDYVVRYEPIAELVFEMPDELALEADHLDLQLVTATSQNGSSSEESGTPLHVNPVDEESAALSLLGARRLRVMLPQPRIGRFAVRIRYRPAPSVAGAADRDWSIPLIHADDGKFVRHQATVRASHNVTVTLDSNGEENSWQPAPLAKDGDARNAASVFASNAPELFLPLAIETGRPDSAAVTVVERVWLQTWISKELQQDRAAFRLRTTGDQVTVELPPAAAEFELLVDKEPAEVVSRAPGRVVVRVSQSNEPPTLSGSGAPTLHTLELRYRQPHEHNTLARHQLIPPQIEGSTALSQVYWHIVLPGNEHVVYSPQQLASASQWQWLGTFWGRRPLKSQAELEAWVGAAEQPAPVGGQSEYLFTGLLPVASMEVGTMPRWLIVLAASAVVLALAIAWVYVAAARRTWILAVVAVAIAAAAITYPSAAMLLAQASAIGLVLAVVSMILTRVLVRPARMSVVPIVSPSSQRMATPRTDSMLLQPVFSAASTAPTASLRGSDSER